MAKPLTGMRKRGEVWYGRLVESGQMRERRLSADLDVALRIFARLRARADEAAAGIAPAAQSEPPAGDLLGLYLADLRRRATAGHARDVESGIRQLLARLDGGQSAGNSRAIGDLKTREISRVRSEMIARGMSHRSAGKLVGYLSTWLRWCHRHGHLSVPPCQMPPPLPKTKHTVTHARRRLTPEECERLQAAADAMGPIGHLVAVALGSGMRLREMLGMRWADVTPDGLRVSAARSKTGRGRVVAIPRHLRDRLEPMRGGAREFVLQRAPGEPWTLRVTQRAMGRLREAAGLPHRDAEGGVLDWHALRHTYATALAASGASMSVLQAQLGWSSPAMAQVYLDLSRLASPAQAAADAITLGVSGHQMGKRDAREAEAGA